MSNLESKINQSIELIHEYAPYAEIAGGYKVGFSGGKDSQVLYQLFKESGEKFTAVYNVTTNDPPDNVRFIRKNYPDVHFNIPKLNFWQLAIKKKALPTRIMRFCCSYFKEQSKGFYALGCRKEESFKRSRYETISLNNRKQFDKEKYKGEYVRFYPILEWREDEIWEYIEMRGITPNPLYETFGRVGCMFCPFANKKQMIYWFEKYPKIKVQFIRTIDELCKNGYMNKYQPLTSEKILDWYMSKQPAAMFFGQLNIDFLI